MATTWQPHPDPADDGFALTKLPRPIPEGIEVRESLGRWIDNLFGAERDRRRAEAELAPMLMSVEEMPPEPPLVPLPPPFPDA